MIDKNIITYEMNAPVTQIFVSTPNCFRDILFKFVPSRVCMCECKCVYYYCLAASIILLPHMLLFRHFSYYMHACACVCMYLKNILYAFTCTDWVLQMSIKWYRLSTKEKMRCTKYSIMLAIRSLSLSLSLDIISSIFALLKTSSKKYYTES